MEPTPDLAGASFDQVASVAELLAGRDRLDRSLAAGGLRSWDWDLRTDRVVWGEGDELLGIDSRAFDLSPGALLDLVHPDDRGPARGALRTAAADASDVHLVLRLDQGGGRARSIELHGRRVSATRIVGVAADVTERQALEDGTSRLLGREHRARVESERVSARLAFLDEAGAVLSATLDPAQAFATMADLVAPGLADVCVVDAIDGDGTLVETALATSAAVDADDVRALRRRRMEAGGDGLWSVRRSIRTGQAELFAEVVDAQLVEAAVDAEHLALLRRVDPSSALTVPLVARGRALGGLTILTSGDRRLTAEDLVLMRHLAERAAMAVDNARLFESRSRVAATLQHALLPPALPVIAGIEVQARYRVAESETGVGDGLAIGGDFYDLFEVGDGAWAAVVGDVCGKGTEAAALTGLLRHTVRAAAVGGGSPSAVLGVTNDAIAAQIDDSRFCTAVLARLEPIPAGVAVSVASGGHPAPVVLRAGGGLEVVPALGTLLGVVTDPSFTDVRLTLGPGDSLVLFTDGVSEARRGSEEFGEHRLLEVLAEVAGAGVDRVIDHLVAALDEFRDGRASDDSVVLVLRADPRGCGSMGGGAGDVRSAASTPG